MDDTGEDATYICGSCDGDGYVGRFGTVPCRPCRTTGEVQSADQAADDEAARIDTAEFMSDCRMDR